MLIVNNTNNLIGITMPDGETYVLGPFKTYMNIARVAQKAIEAWIG